MRWRPDRLHGRQQVANGPCGAPGPAPASGSPAALVVAAWMPVLTGQAIPLIGEYAYRRLRDDDCYDD